MGSCGGVGEAVVAELVEGGRWWSRWARAAGKSRSRSTGVLKGLLQPCALAQVPG